MAGVLFSIQNFCDGKQMSFDRHIIALQELMFVNVKSLLKMKKPRLYDM